MSEMDMNKQLKKEDIILKCKQSEEVQEIMGRMPSWIIRWGITVIAIMSTVIIIGSYFFQYPDIILARVTISSVNPSVKLIARKSLPIDIIFVENNSHVDAGEALCLLSSTADFDQVKLISSYCKQLDTIHDLRRFTLNSRVPALFNLGELQRSYVSLLQAEQQYVFFLQHNNYYSKIKQLSIQRTYQAMLSAQLLRKGQHLDEQFSIQQLRFQSDSQLVANQVMSLIEYENARKDLLAGQISAEGNYSTILQSQLQEKEIQKNILATSIELQTQENILQQKMFEAAKRFSGDYAEWEEIYLLKSPVSGIVSFSKYWKENQFVEAGAVVMVVSPYIQNYVARGELGISGAGKVKPGQTVLIKLTAYPYMEFGSLVGSLQARSIVAVDSLFTIEIKLNERLKTNAGQTIPDQPQLVGVAEIITEKKSILSRLFKWFK